MREGRGVEGASPTFGLPRGAEGPFADGVQFGVHEPERDAHIGGNLAPIVVEPVEFIAHPQRSPWRDCGRAKTESDVSGRGRQARHLPWSQWDRLAIDAEGTDFQKRIVFVGGQLLGCQTPTYPANQPAEA